MAKEAPKKQSSAPQGDPRQGDEILKRMLKAKPKTHDEMVTERRAPRRSVEKAKRKKPKAD